MRESVIYTQIYQEGEVRGEQRGRSEGRKEEATTLVIRQLTRKLGDIAPTLISQINNLPVEAVEFLGEALLDFRSISDLEAWFEIER